MQICLTIKTQSLRAYELDGEIVQIYLRKSQKHKSAGLNNIFNRNISRWALMFAQNPTIRTSAHCVAPFGGVRCCFSMLENVVSLCAQEKDRYWKP